MPEVISYEIEITPASLKKAIADAAKVSNAAKLQAAQIKAQDRADQVSTKAKMAAIAAQNKAALSGIKTKERAEAAIIGTQKVRDKEALANIKKVEKATLASINLLETKKREALKQEARIAIENERAKARIAIEAARGLANAQRGLGGGGGRGGGISNRTNGGLLGGMGSGRRGILQSLVAGIGLGYAARQFGTRFSGGIGGIGTAISQGLVGNVSGSMKGAVRGIGGIGGALAGGAGSIAGGIGGGLIGAGFGGIGGALGGIGSGVLGVGGSIGGGISGAIGGGIAGAGLGVAGGALLGKAVEGLANEISKVIDVLDSMVQEFYKFNPALSMMVAIFKYKTLEFDIIMGRLTQPITTAWMKIKTDFLDVIIDIVKTATPLIDIFTRALEAVDRFIKKIDSFFGGSPSGNLADTGIHTAGALPAGWLNNMGNTPSGGSSFQDGLQKTWEYIKTLTNDFFEKTLKPDVEAFWTWLKPKIETWWNELYAWLQPKVVTLIDWIQIKFIDLFTNCFTAIQTAIVTWLNHILPNFMTGAAGEPTWHKELFGPDSLFGGATMGHPAGGTSSTPATKPNSPPISFPGMHLVPEANEQYYTNKYKIRGTNPGDYNLFPGGNLNPFNWGRSPTVNDPNFGSSQSRNFSLNTDVGAMALAGGQDFGNFSSLPAKGSSGAYLPQIDGGVHQTINMNLQNKIVHEQSVRSAIMQIQGKLMEAVFSARNETKLMGGLILGHGDAMGM